MSTPSTNKTTALSKKRLSVIHNHLISPPKLSVTYETRQLQHTSSKLPKKTTNCIQKVECKSSTPPSSSTKEVSVRIGSVSVPLSTPNDSSLVPIGYLRPTSSNTYPTHTISDRKNHSDTATSSTLTTPQQLSLLSKDQSLLAGLQFIMKKQLLKQDVFLIGPPGPTRRRIAMAYCELMRREVEYLCVSPDVTESDIKQRREIKGKTAIYENAAAVRAALLGRILIIDGIEKAERNVLPVINNLLENREMALEDGRFIVSSDRYKELLNLHGKQQINKWNLIRAHPDFLVIAIGLPVPPYYGNPLDPPLRSRFQARTEGMPRVGSQLIDVRRIAPNVNGAVLSRLVSIARVIQELHRDRERRIDIPDFPQAGLEFVAALLSGCPVESSLQFVRYSINFSYPFGQLGKLYLDSEVRNAILSLYDQLDLQETKISTESAVISVLPLNVNSRYFYGTVTLINRVQFIIPLGPTANQFTNGTLDAPPNNNSYNDTNGSRHSELSLCTKYQLCTLGRCLHAHSLGDFCIIGPKGVGKSFLSKAFAELAGYSRDYTTLICLYKDMTTRDLFEGRRTKANGDTYWELSPLLMLALKGGLAILDGVEQIHPATLASLQRLVNDREVSLASGKRFMSVNRCAKLLARLKSDANVKPSEKNLNWLKINHNVYAIHSSFRIVALARPPLGNRGLERGSWMTAENCTIFPFVWVRPLLFKEESRVIKSRAPNVSDEDVATLVQLAQTARSPENEGDEIISSIAESLSTRQLIRLCKQREATNNANSATISLYRGVQRLCLSRFMPSVVRATLEQLLQDHNIMSTSDLSSSGDDLNKDGGMIIRTVVNSEGDDFLHIGPVRKKLDKVSKAPLLVPHLLFYENPRQTKTLMDMLNDFNVGEHLLLIGNQGVGKNKLADYFLKLMRLPREYIQLHRDTTVSQLTTQPSVVDGQLLFADSPLVRAAKEGYVLVVDEADKAPTHVTALLKGLAEDREMMLGDGRRIREMPEEESNSGTTKDVRLHPDFRMIVLANRPGYPFLGNDFFKVVGSVFSTFAIDNPDGASELNLLRNYAGGVPDAVLRKLVAAFTELRQYTEEGTLSYPYSTRELVNAVRHLDKFPKDGISSVLRNIFDFDKFSNEERDILVNAFRRQGIVLDTESNMEITLGVVSVLPEPIHTETWLVGDIRSSDQSSSSKNNSVVTLVTQNIELNHEASELGGMGMGALIVDQFSRYDLRADSFGEAEYRFQVTGRGNIAGTCVLESGRIFVVRHHIGEVDLQLVDLTTDTTRTIQSSFSCPPMKGRGIFRPMPPKITVLPLTGERVLIHNPREHGVSVVDAHTGQCRHYVIPFSKGGIVPTGQRNQPSSYSRVLISGSLNEELFAVYCSGRTELFFVHVDDGTSRFDKNQGDRLFSIQVPFPIFSIKAVSRELWLIQSGTKGSTYHVLQFGPRVLRTRLCSIKRDPTSMEDGLISQLRWLSTSANRIDGSRSVPSGMNDRLFRHLHSNGTYGQLVPGLGAALGAMRGGRVPIFTYLREDYQHKNNSSSSSKNSSTPSTSRPVPSSIVFLKHSRQLVTCTEMNGGTNASVEVVSVREGVVRRVIVPINEPLPETVPGASGSGSNPLDDSRSQNLGFSKFTDNGWKSLTSKPSRATFVNELKDGRLLFNDFCGNYYVLEVRTEEIMGSLEDWANMVGSGRGAEGDIGNLDVGMIVDGEEVGVGSGDGDENGDGDGDGKGDGDGDGEGNGEGNGKGKGKGDGEGQGEGNGKGGGSNTGQRKGNLGANGDLPDPMLEYEMMQQEVQDNLDKERKSGRNEDGMTPEVEAQVKAAKAEAWRRLLEKIDMDEADLLKYEAYRKRVVTEIRQLRVVLESLEARKNERTWLRNKDAGDLDDRRLIDGLTGSRNIYKARGEQPPDMGSFQELPKRIHFLFDLSMSMSRYAMDGRLQRSLEAATMVMESFRGFDHKYKYKIGGHSGDSEKLVFVEEGKPPANDRERLQVIRKMHAHSDLCDSGDNTLTSVRYAVREIVKQDADEHAVFLLSDANLEQYGIGAKELLEVLNLDQRVRVFIIFIGSLGDQANRLTNSMPAGNVFVALNTSDIPMIIKNCLSFMF